MLVMGSVKTHPLRMILSKHNLRLSATAVAVSWENEFISY